MATTTLSPPSYQLQVRLPDSIFSLSSLFLWPILQYVVAPDDERVHDDKGIEQGKADLKHKVYGKTLLSNFHSSRYPHLFQSSAKVPMPIRGPLVVEINIIVNLSVATDSFICIV